ncbi:hypothetical protein IJS77_05735 [bacterium]|nr:hypothetical protein [bacterium]
MENNFNNFDNQDLSLRKSTIIQERINLISTHMYKQYLEYEKSMLNMNEVFSKMKSNIGVIIDSLKQSFSSRGIATQNINYEIDSSGTVIVINILWHQISILIRYNDFPQALKREEERMFASRIIAIQGNYFEILKKVKDNDIEPILEFETASLYIPSEKSKPAIMKIKGLNKESPQSQIDAPRDFLLKVIELVCGGGLEHKEWVKKNITFDI